ncbi:hypothetical protein LCGC14_0481860 [marine sediment metagenome]|uniref:Uncharacterized protein n=1 Tax=marine sediment metagenome TaxID=412755 RepID=A0A0F9UWA1_9ZZZZ
MQIKRTFAVVPLSKASGHGVVRDVELFGTEERAIAHARRSLGLDTTRTGFVVYQATTLVQWATQPIDVCTIGDDGEILPCGD